MCHTFMQCTYKNMKDSNWRVENVSGDGEMQ